MKRFDDLLRWSLVCCVAVTIAPLPLGGVPQRPSLEDVSLSVIDDPFEPVLYHHEAAVNQFLGSPGFGQGRMTLGPMRVVPPLPPPLHEKEFSYNITWSDDQGHYNVPVVDLLGLVKAPKPRVYTIQQDIYRAEKKQRPPLFDKERLSLPVNAILQIPGDWPTRAPDPFEQKALALLQAGHQLVCKQEGPSFRALGAIRAQKSCLSCHDTANNGDLLGAFTYFGAKTRDATEAERQERQKERKYANNEGQDAPLIAKNHPFWDGFSDIPAMNRDHGLSRHGVVSTFMVERQRALRASLPVRPKKGH